MSTVVPERYNASLLVDRNVEAGRGEKAAYLAPDATLTYDGLRRQANRAGHLLRELGVRREDRVLMVLDDTTAFPTLFLGALKIGAVPVPVSPLDRIDNYRHYAEDSYADIVATDAALLPRMREALDGVDVRYLVRGVADSDVAELDSGLVAQSDELDPAPTHRDDMAFWLYSSGSTGKPKGVVHLHHDIEVTCETFARQVLGLREDDIVFSTTKLFHAYGLGNSLSFTLWFGATAVLMAGPTRPEPILAKLREHRPTVFCSVPALYSGLVREDAADGALDSVRLCVSAAEALPPHTFDRWQERFGLEIVDGIGSTEMLHIFCSNRPGAVRRGTTGEAVPGTSCASPTRTAGSSKGRPSATSRSAATRAPPSTGTSTRRRRPACGATGSPPATATSAARTAPTCSWAAPTRCSRSAAYGSPPSTWST